MMKRLFVLAVLMAGCSASPGAATGEPVRLLTGSPRGMEASGCFTSAADGQLLVDPKYGTAIIDESVRATTPTPVMWRPGFTGRHVGAEVEVLDRDGKVVAVTGRKYRIAGGYVGGATDDVPIADAFWACDAVVQR